MLADLNGYAGYAAAAAVALAAACSSSPPASAAPPPGTATPAPVVRPGDAISVEVWREDDLSGRFVVDDRGVVTLPLLGERQVAELDPAALHDALLSEYREYLQNPSIDVTVLRRVSVLGAVREPGLYQVDATISLWEALGMAGGIAPTGNPEDIRVIRSGEVVITRLDHTAAVGAFDIRSGDRIVVAEKGWLARNTGALLGSVVGAAAGITIALIR